MQTLEQSTSAEGHSEEVWSFMIVFRFIWFWMLCTCTLQPNPTDSATVWCRRHWCCMILKGSTATSSRSSCWWGGGWQT